MTCAKCNSTGYIAEYKHIQDGICFDCGGTGDSTKKAWTKEQEENFAKLYEHIFGRSYKPESK